MKAAWGRALHVVGLYGMRVESVHTWEVDAQR